MSRSPDPCPKNKMIMVNKSFPNMPKGSIFSDNGLKIKAAFSPLPLSVQFTCSLRS